MKKVVTVLLSIMVLTACWNKREEMTGYAPIYASPTQIKTISLTTAQPYENGGKIYVYGHTLYQVENGKGIHITDISNPAAPEKKGFIKVTGCQEISVNDDLIYANNMNDLVVIKLGTGASVVKRLPKSFKNLVIAGRPPEKGRFECPDTTKGIVVGWQKKTLINPSCYY